MAGSLEQLSIASVGAAGSKQELSHPWLPLLLGRSTLTAIQEVLPGAKCLLPSSLFLQWRDCLPWAQYNSNPAGKDIWEM